MVNPYNRCSFKRVCIKCKRNVRSNDEIFVGFILRPVTNIAIFFSLNETSLLLSSLFVFPKEKVAELDENLQSGCQPGSADRADNNLRLIIFG